MKRIIFMILTLVFFVFLTGCEMKTNNDADYEYRNKPMSSFLVNYKIKEETIFDDNIEIEIFFGTESSEKESAEIYMINNEYVKNSENRNDDLLNENKYVVAKIDDFCKEKYEMINHKKLLGSITYNIPKSIFINESGAIIISLELSSDSDIYSVILIYEIVNNMILFNERKKNYENIK